MDRARRACVTGEDLVLIHLVGSGAASPGSLAGRAAFQPWEQVKTSSSSFTLWRARALGSLGLAEQHHSTVGGPRSPPGAEHGE